MFNKIAFFNYYLRKKRDLRKDGKASFIFLLLTIYVDRKQFYIKLMSPLEKVGKICFTAYYIHYLLIFILEKYASFFFKYFPPAISNLIILVLVPQQFNYRSII